MTSSIDFKWQKLLFLVAGLSLIVILWVFFGYTQLKTGNAFQEHIVDGVIQNVTQSAQPAAPALLKSLEKTKLWDLKFDTENMIYSTTDNYETLTSNDQVTDEALKNYLNTNDKVKLITFGNNISNKTYVLKKDGTGETNGNAVSKEQLKFLGKDISAVGLGSFSSSQADEIINKHFPRGNKVKLSDDKYLVVIEMLSVGWGAKVNSSTTWTNTTTTQPSVVNKILIPSTININGETFNLKHVGEELNNSNKNQTIENPIENGKKLINISLSEWPSHSLVGNKTWETLSCNVDFKVQGNACVADCANPIYLDSNGVTVKAKACAVAGQTYQWNGESWYVARDKFDIRNKIFADNFPATKIITSKVNDMSLLFIDQAFITDYITFLGKPMTKENIPDFDYKADMEKEIEFVKILKKFDMATQRYTTSSFNQDISNWDTSNVTNMAYVFNWVVSFNQNINDWNVSNVTDMDGMFFWATLFNQPLNNWKVNKVSNMSKMFREATSFNQNINNWNVSNVKDMSYMFNWASSFNQPLNNWDTSNVTDMHGMFWSSDIFNQPIWNWNTRKVTNMRYMFYMAYKFNQPLNDWNTSKVIDMYGMFEYAKVFNQPIWNWNTSKVTNMGWMFHWATSFNQPIGNWNTSNVENMALMFQESNSFNQDISKWDVNKVKSMGNMISWNTPLNHSYAPFYNFSTNNKK